LKRRIICILLSVALLCSLLSGCGKTRYADNLEAYAETMEYHDGFTILQLTDIHWDCGTPVEESREYIRGLIAEVEAHAGKIDLIEVTGDIFMLGEQRSVTTFIDFMTEVNIPYAVVWGNHDRGGNYSPNWLSEQFLNAPNCLYLEVDNDDVHGRSNYIINLTEGGEIVWQLIELDSGASLWNGAGLELDYDYIRQNQLDWMTAMHEIAGAEVPALCYYHIPQMDAVNAMDAFLEGSTAVSGRFFKNEAMCNSEKALDLTEVYAACNVKGAFFGHDHSNDLTVTTKNGVVLGYGVKTGRELYYAKNATGEHKSGEVVTKAFDLIGASLVTLTDRRGGFTLEHLYYEGEGGYIEWRSY